MQWLYGLGLYFRAEREIMLVARAATYLRGIALEWWQHHGAVLPPDASFNAFKKAFLKRFVKPSDSAKARRKIALLQQGDSSVEAHIDTFLSTNMRITVSSPTDKTTLAGYFVAGLLKHKVKDALSTSATNVEAMHDLPQVMEAAVDLETC